MKIVQTTILFLICVFFFVPEIPAQHHDPDSLQALKTDAEISIDGQLSEPAWSVAMHIPNFVQRELNEGQPATERTEVAMLYNEQNLYIGFWGYDSKPGQITATQMERDFDWRSGKYLGFSADYEYNTFDLSGGSFDVHEIGLAICTVTLIRCNS